MKKILFIALGLGTAAVILWFLDSGKNKPKTEDYLVVAIGSEPRSLDPRFATDATSQRITDLIFQPLLSLKDQKLYPGMAFAWENHGRQYTFLVSKNIYFSNGRKLKAEDILFSFQEYQSKKSPFAGTFQIIEKVQLKNPVGKEYFTLKIKLKTPSAKFLRADLPVLKILPKTEVLSKGRDFYKNPIGSGPFHLKSQNSSRIVLETRPLWPKHFTPIPPPPDKPYPFPTQY